MASLKKIDKGATILVRGAILHFLADPGATDDPAAWAHLEDGGLLIEQGRVAQLADWSVLEAGLTPQQRAGIQHYDYRGSLVLPGLIDTHLHYPQAGIIASYGHRLLDWLNHYTFPAEASFADPAVAARTADYVLDRLLANGTTTASVFATVHAHSADAFFEAAERRGLRMLCGKVMMDRNGPPELLDTAASAERDCRTLIERWHGRGRLRYSLTPRFAPTSTPGQLDVAGALYAAWPDLHVQSHLAENAEEVAWVRELFPDRRCYLDVYAHHGLLGPRAIYGHCIHLSEAERRWMADAGSAAAFCPTSNLFLGSGFFNYAAARDSQLKVGLATDVGGGTSFSLLRTLAEAYKVAQAAGGALPPMRAFYLATLGGAEALGLADSIGSFQTGREADFVVLDPSATAELAWRLESCHSLAERLFALAILGDERCVRATHILGQPAYLRPA
ncbi:guanine deaminase [Chitinimonas sp.]|uniref:guanine deaminase n=1 Tax=Chitinimonas sp. TaxID=1934313 RepID=UPI002F94D7BC